MNNQILKTIDIRFKKLLVEAIDNSVDMLKDFKRENNYFTNNHRASIRWDFINDSMVRLLRSANLPYASFTAGFWTLLLFCDKIHLFSIMRQDRLNYICSNPEKNAPKYFDSLVSLNCGLNAKYSQLSIDDFEVYTANDKYNQLESICKKLPHSKKEKFTHILIVFDVVYDDIVSLKLCVVNNKFEIVEEEDILQSVLSASIPNITQENSAANNISSNNNAISRGYVKLKSFDIRKES